MKNYINYIIENLRSDTQELSVEEFITILKTNCKEFLKNPVCITRSLYLSNKYLLIDPKKYNRTSKTKDNIYNIIIDEYWTEIPKRSQSICCANTLNRSYLDIFGDQTYLVIPFDNSKWGVCPGNDMWASLYIFGLDIKGFINIFNSLYSYFFNEALILEKVKTLDELKEYCKKLHEEFLLIKDKENEIYVIKNILNNNSSFYVALSDGELYDRIIEQMTTNKSNFQSIQYKDIRSSFDNRCGNRSIEIINPIKINELIYAKELWTDSKCLLLNITDHNPLNTIIGVGDVKLTKLIKFVKKLREDN
jgi:hypothetical protein